jgi:hypothetical protein
LATKNGAGVLSRTIAPGAYFCGRPQGWPMTNRRAELGILPLVRMGTGVRPVTGRSRRTTAQSVPSAASCRPIRLAPE